MSMQTPREKAEVKFYASKTSFTMHDQDCLYCGKRTSRKTRQTIEFETVQGLRFRLALCNETCKSALIQERDAFVAADLQ